ncbi:MAG TPA: DUF2332 domain-containing protein [Burkholderiaceae bacterium]|nr:DUF2332 domain-containing protein [Burkholderiaceae bacterium]
MAADGAALAKHFTYFADHEVTGDPLYVALCRHVAASPDLLELMQHAPPTQRVPNLLLASVHDRVLAGVPHALREYFPSAGGTRRPDADLPATFDDFVAAQREALCALLATRSTQTNEIGRCAVLWPALGALAHRCGHARLALFDFGSSAGLNLGADGYRYHYDAFALGDPHSNVPPIDCHVVGDHAALQRAGAHTPQIVARLGVDPAPVDVHDDVQVRWLRACLWPYDRVRLTRFDAAVTAARQRGVRVLHHDDCAAAIEPWLETLPADVQPVVFNSWVLHYFDKAARAAHVQRMRGWVQRHRIAWLSAEGAHIPLGDAPPAQGGDAVVSDEQLAKGSLWWLTLCDRGGTAPITTLLARSHPHGRWVQWLDRG